MMAAGIKSELKREEVETASFLRDLVLKTDAYRVQIQRQKTWILSFNGRSVKEVVANF